MSASRARVPRGRGRLLKSGPSPMRRLIEDAKVELIPMKSLQRAVTELAPASHISMTCSPAKSIEDTLDESAALIAAGHTVTPHISARMVHSLDHLAAIRHRLVDLGMRDIFVVGGDIEEPGCFFDAIEFIAAFIGLDDDPESGGRQVDHIGYTSYPDSHPFISQQQLHDALHAKQRLVLDSGRTGHVSTQMCFSCDQIRTWLRAERAAGFTLPVHLGVAGVVDTSKLMTMGMRLGVGTSLRYLKKNRKALGKLLTQRSYQPGSLLRPLTNDLDELGIEGIHLYTFNQVATTEAWRTDTLN